MLLLIILNFYSFAGYSWFDTRFKARVRYDKPDGEDYFIEEYLCETPLHCILSLLQHGLRESQGLGTFEHYESYENKSNYTYVLLYDFSFFIIITLIMLNIINGIIIDAFADLRDKQALFEHDVDNVCFICGLDRWQFEKNGKDFNKHVEKKHFIWSYVNFLIYLIVLGRENANGIETLIMNKIANNQLNWIPYERTYDL